MDPSALIFVALAVAWAVYLVPKALEHHDESLRSRTISTFSHTMRVLARREAASDRTTRLVPGGPARTTRAPALASTPAAPAAEVPAQSVTPSVALSVTRGRSAAARRRNVLAVLVLANVAVAGAAGFRLVSWVWMAAPVALLVAWLVACRLMVRRERAVRRQVPMGPAAERDVAAAAAPAVPVTEAGEVVEGAVLMDDATSDIPAVPAGADGSWDPVDVPLPTYVSKPPAMRRTVRTIDLDSTGVWSSGRSESDSALAREADAARRDSRQERTERRASGS